MLYIVATPIGNLKEITFRAIEVLKDVKYILCEDTRTSKVLLDAYDIHKPLKSYHKFNEVKVSSDIIEDLKSGVDIALISDAGMPGISDPGNILINEAIKNNIEYTVVSGASALINAYVMSGFEPPFTFVGFLPENNVKREKLLENLCNAQSVLIFYMSSHSIEDDLKKLYLSLGKRRICVVREISKKFEEKTFGYLGEDIDLTIKGEFVVLVNKPEETISSNSLDNDLQVLLDMGISKTDASKVLAKARGLKKNDVYKNTYNK